MNNRMTTTQTAMNEYKSSEQVKEQNKNREQETERQDLHRQTLLRDQSAALAMISRALANGVKCGASDWKMMKLAASAVGNTAVCRMFETEQPIQTVEMDQPAFSQMDPCQEEAATPQAVVRITQPDFSQSNVVSSIDGGAFG